MRSVQQESAVARLAAITAALETRGRRLRAVVALPGDVARAEAAHRDALQAAGIALGPLHGVPIAVKDIIDVAGLPTRGGSATSGDPPPAAADAFVVARLRAAGVIVAAKTATVEFAFGGWGTNPSQGAAHNPYRPAEPHTCGGSSSGTGALVGAGILPAGLGSDTGGSVRIPAAFCGCGGLKTSIGLVSRSGVLPLSDTFDTIGPLTDTVARAAEMLAVMQGEDRTDPSTLGIARPEPVAELHRGVAGLRLARLADDRLGRADPEILRHFDAACGALEAAGARITELRLPASHEAYQSRITPIIAAEAYTFHGAFADNPQSALNPATRKRILVGAGVSARERILAQRARMQDIADFLAVMDRHDALLLPTTPVVPMPIAAVDEDDAAMSLYTRFANYLDLCALSVPMGLTQVGFPTGLQIVGRHLDDPLVLRIGQAFETARDPLPLPPLMAASL